MPTSAQTLRSEKPGPGSYFLAMKTILVPVDLSAATVRVCDAACALAQLIQAVNQAASASCEGCCAHIQSAACCALLAAVNIARGSSFSTFNHDVM